MADTPDILDRLLQAIGAEDATDVAVCLDARPEFARAEIPAEHGHSQTVLHRAIPGDGDALTEAKTAIVGRLLDAGAAVDAPGWGPNLGICTPLTIAAWGGHASLIRLLVARGADPEGLPDVPTRHRPIETAARHGHAAAVDALIEAGARHTLAHLLMAGLTERLERQIERDPGLAARPLEDGTPPLHLALTAPNSAAMLDLLLRHGADSAARDSFGRNALHIAIEQERPADIERLRPYTSPLDLFAAAGLGDSGRVAVLLRQEPSLAQAAQEDGVTAIFYAAAAGDVASARCLLDHGAAVTPRAKRWWACLTPLHVALQKGHHEVAALLLERGADPEADAADPGEYWPTPLHVADRWGSAADIALLREHGADPNGGRPVVDSIHTGLRRR